MNSTSRTLSFVVSILLILGFVSTVAAQSYPTIKYRKAADHVGDIVWVEGKILRSEKANTGTYLLFHANKKYVRILIPTSDLKNFEHGVKHYTGKSVKAVGKVAQHGKLLILGVNEPKRLKVVN